MLIDRLIKMYGLRHKHIRIEDQQSNLKINIMIRLILQRKTIFKLRLYNYFQY